MQGLNSGAVFMAVGFDHVFQGFKTGATLRLLTAGTIVIDAGHLVTAALLKMFFDFLVVEWVAEANEHRWWCP